MKQKQSTIHPILGNLAEDRMSMQRVKSQPSTITKLLCEQIQKHIEKHTSKNKFNEIADENNVIHGANIERRKITEQMNETKRKKKLKQKQNRPAKKCTSELNTIFTSNENRFASFFLVFVLFGFYIVLFQYK